MQSNKEVVLQWFRREETCNLMLPDGWFGRPYDNLYRLTSLEETPDNSLIMDLGGMKLLFDDLRLALDQGEKLLLSEFKKLVVHFTNVDYVFHSIYDTGTVKIMRTLNGN